MKFLKTFSIDPVGSNPIPLQGANENEENIQDMEGNTNQTSAETTNIQQNIPSTQSNESYSDGSNAKKEGTR